MNLAGLGVVAYLLLTKVETRLSSLERAVTRLVVVAALELVSRPDIARPVKDEARQLIADVRADAAARGEPSFLQEGKDV